MKRSGQRERGGERDGRGRKPGDLLHSRALLYLVSKASAPGLGISCYSLHRNIRRSALFAPIIFPAPFIDVVFSLLHPSTAASRNHLLFLTVVTYMSLLRRYYSTCERWSSNQSFSSSFSFLVVFNCNEMYYRMFHLISLKNSKKNIEKHRFLLREKKIIKHIKIFKF